MTVFYRKYRPQKFADLIGQDAAKKTLLSQLETGRISHGYLFCGPKGTGKTSTARIFAKAVNCQRLASSESASSKKLNAKRYPLNAKFGEPCNKCTSCLAISDGSHLDLLEIDAASNRNIDDVRDLREKIKLSPVSARFKVYIVDEAHMLTREAFNALLKTLEEPPAHAIFILCTTEVNKLPQTIISRVQRFNFLRATREQLIEAITKIAKLEGIKLDKEAISAVVAASDGSYRDAISILDQLSTSARSISEKDVSAVATLSDWNHTFSFVRNLIDLRLKEVVLVFEDLVAGGFDLSFFTKEVVLFLEKLLLMKLGFSKNELDLEPDQLARMEEIAVAINAEDLQNLMRLFLIAESEIKLYPLPQIPLILAACKFCLPRKETVEKSGLMGSDIRQFLKEQKISEAQDKSRDQRKEGKDEKAKSSPKKEAPDKKDKTAKEKSKTLGQIEAKWSEFLNKIRPINTHVMAILRATSPVKFENGHLTLEVFYRFHKEKLEEPKIREILEKILKETVGEPIRLRFVLAPKDTRRPKPVRESDLVDVDVEKLERISTEIQEIFSK